MLSRFKNALYGSSTGNDDTSLIRVEYDYREAVLSKRITRSLTRSSSFREDLRDLARPRNNSTISALQRKSKDLDSLPTSSGCPIVSHYPTKGDLGEYKHVYKVAKLPKYRYSRPEFLQLKTDDEIIVSADHQIRPIILPRDVARLPWKSGYAECINAGKSLRNEDQAAFYQDVAVSTRFTNHSSHSELKDPSKASQECVGIPWVYFGIFDGHAGTAVAVAAASQLHNIVSEKLRNVTDLLVSLEFIKGNEEPEEDLEFMDCTEKLSNGTKSSDDNKDEIKVESKVIDDDQDNNNSHDSTSEEPDSAKTLTEQDKVVSDETPSQDRSEKQPERAGESPPTKVSTSVNGVDKPKVSSEQNLSNSPDRRFFNMVDICRNNITVESLVTGVLESAFWEMDALIAQDKQEYKMPGGCTAIVGLFILGKLYVCNAGDSRAIVCKNNEVIPMSFDFTPVSEKERILRLGLQHPEFLGSDFTHLEFLKKPTRKDLGKQMLYKDAYMTGWSMKTITYDDLKFPLVWGEGKRSRVLATIGVTRGFGDHELRAQYGSVLIKPFLTPEPEVKVLDLENDESLTPDDVLIMGSDGLWDVTPNQEAAEVVKLSFDLFPDNEESRSKYRYITAAQDLVIISRGHTTNWNNVWRLADERLASLDDIAVFVIPLKQYRDEYLEWKRLYSSRFKANS